MLPAGNVGDSLKDRLAGGRFGQDIREDQLGESPSQRLLILIVAGVGFTGPLPKSAPTRANSAASKPVGWNGDQTPAVSQCQPLSPGHPPGLAETTAAVPPHLNSRPGRAPVLRFPSSVRLGDGWGAGQRIYSCLPGMEATPSDDPGTAFEAGWYVRRGRRGGVRIPW
jgi:hypothetical protein